MNVVICKCLFLPGFHRYISVYFLYELETSWAPSFYTGKRKYLTFCEKIATTDNKCTLGFISTPKSYPMTLLKGNELDIDKMKDVSLVLQKKAGEEKFNEIIIGNPDALIEYYPKIKEHIDKSLIFPILLEKIKEHQDKKRQDTAQKKAAVGDLDKQSK